MGGSPEAEEMTYLSTVTIPLTKTRYISATEVVGAGSGEGSIQTGQQNKVWDLAPVLSNRLLVITLLKLEEV
jgi:hypothetical protein